MPESDRPGLLVLVVGPSGAGKDTLIDGARAVLADRPIRFARRIVTRPASAAEDHDSLDPDTFALAEAAGAFAFHWRAHGLRYAIPVAVMPWLRAGDTVVCNVSRGVVETVRGAFPKVRVIYVDAPLAVRLGRIAGRGRPSETPERGRREGAFTPVQADAVVQNDGTLQAAVDAFVAAVVRP